VSEESSNTRSREVECDLLVVGSGAGGLSAAVTAAWHGLKVIVVEKDAVCGGATAWSGGWMWVPCNALSRADGIVEDPELPRTYLRHELGNNYDAARVEAFLAAGPPMVDFFHKHTELQFVSGTWIADIHGNTPGAGTGGRSVAPKPFDGRRLGAALLSKARRQKYKTSLFGMGVMAGPICTSSCMPPGRSRRWFTQAAAWRGTHSMSLFTDAACSSSTVPRWSRAS